MKTKEDILALLEEEDVEFVRLQFTDMFGQDGGKETEEKYLKINNKKTLLLLFMGKTSYNRTLNIS